jgi:hypothetical protein
MATAIKIWEISGGTLKSPISGDFSANYVESQLEDLIVNNPELLGEGVLIIDRQRDIAGVGRIDLLGIEDDGGLVIVELKRDLTSRQAVAQALDYASWLDLESPQRIATFADEFLKKTQNKNLSEAFSEKFDTDLPEVNCQNHRILLVRCSFLTKSKRHVGTRGERQWRLRPC